MKKTIILSTLVLATVFMVTCTNNTNDKNGKDSTATTSAFPNDSLNKDPFPDFGYMLPPDSIHGPVFKLSQNYPTTLPDTTNRPDFFNIDFKTDWKKYLLAVQQYCFEGNTDVDFRVEHNKKRDWYHMPWQHYGPHGREGFHGLTEEAPVKPQQLAVSQNYPNAVAWAVGFYNDIGGYTIGQVWKDHLNPDPTKSIFKNGTVVFKLLFVSLPVNEVETQVPSLVNPVQWDVYGLPTFSSTQHTKMKMTLLQMDILVKDSRAPQGWIFGNFQYNGNMKKTNPWENLVPVGIMWGEDPTNNTNFSNPIPKSTIINSKLTQTIINPDANELPPSHLGWNSRLDGPLDNPMSSCYSCHGTAEYPQNSPISPLFYPKTHPTVVPGSTEWMRWFANIACGVPFDTDCISTDFSLQMAVALQNFYQWRDAQDGLFAKEYPTYSAADTLKGTQEMLIAPAPQKKKIYPIRRNE